MFCLLNNPLFFGVLKIHIFKYPASCAVIFSDTLYLNVLNFDKFCIIGK